MSHWRGSARLPCPRPGGLVPAGTSLPSSSLTPTLTHVPLKPRKLGSPRAFKPASIWQVNRLYLILQKSIMG